MRLYTDAPDELRNAFPDEPSWREVPTASFEAADRTLWGIVSPKPTAFAWDPGERLRIGNLRRMVVIGDAPASQFSSLMSALASGVALPDGSALLALQGTGFKGQRGRPWSARKGNIHLCVYYHANARVDRIGAGLTMLPAVAVMDAIGETCGHGLEAGIKWVNDIVIGGKKVAGVLTATQTRERVFEHVVLGIGINVGVVPKIDPTPFVPRAGCLRDVAEVSWPSVLFALLHALDMRYRHLRDAGPEDLLHLYRKYSVIIGRDVRIWADSGNDAELGPPIAGGVVERINDDLSLALQGRSEPVDKGRLAFAEACWELGA